MSKPNSRTNQKMTNDKFWQFRNLAGDDQKAELLLYGDISERSWWEDAATPKWFADDLAALGDVKEITVYINSGGGDVFAAQAIGNMLERNAATVTAHIDGLCASAATIVACQDVYKRQAQGDLHRTEDVERGLKAIFANFKNRLETIPTKYAKTMAQLTDPVEAHDILQKAVEEALIELSNPDVALAEPEKEPEDEQEE